MKFTNRFASCSVVFFVSAGLRGACSPLLQTASKLRSAGFVLLVGKLLCYGVTASHGAFLAASAGCHFAVAGVTKMGYFCLNL